MSPQRLVPQRLVPQQLVRAIAGRAPSGYGQELSPAAEQFVRTRQALTRPRRTEARSGNS